MHPQQILGGYSYATGCKASGTLKVGEFTFGETSYIISSSAGKGTRSACASSRDSLGLSQSFSSCSRGIVSDHGVYPVA